MARWGGGFWRGGEVARWRGGKRQVVSGVPFFLCAKVEVEKEGIQFTADFETAFLIPDKRRSVIATVEGKGLKAVGCVDELEKRVGEMAR